MPGRKRQRQVKAGSHMEAYVADLFQMAGYTVYLNDVRFDKEFDVVAEKSVGLDTSRILVECKDHAENVGLRQVSNFFNVSEMLIRSGRAQQAIAVARKGFTPQCRAHVAGLDRITSLSIEELEDQLVGLPTVRERTSVNVERARARLLQLPSGLHIPVECQVNSGENSIREVDTELDRWVEDAGSNLAVVFGPFGSGKSTSLLRFVERQRDGFKKTHWRTVLYLDYDDVAPTVAAGSDLLNAVVAFFDAPSLGSTRGAGRLSHLLVVLDGFDAVNRRAGLQLPTPDLRDIESVARSGIKIVIGSRQWSRGTNDELIRQLTDQPRMAGLGMRNPLILELQPWSPNTIKAAADALPGVDSTPLVNYLSNPNHRSVDFLRRPLVLQMLIEVGSDLLEGEQDLMATRSSTAGPRAHSAPHPLSIKGIYDGFIKLTLERDYDRNNSQIRFDDKMSILAQIANDIFQGERSETSGIGSVTGNGIDGMQLDLRVLEKITQTRQLVEPTLGPKYGWTFDFLHSVHLIVEVGSARTDPNPRFSFVHPTFYEYFLSRHLISRVLSGRSFGIAEHVSLANEALFDSLVPYFLTEARNEVVDQHLVSSLRGDIDNADRMVAIYLLEERPDILDLLKASPPQYATYLESKERHASSHFLKKLVRYQLLLMTGDPNRALEYVRYLQEHEREGDADLELSIFSVGEDPTDSLLRRLDSPHLRAAAPITIFRLGQFGNETAVPHLERVRSNLKERAVQGLIDHAIRSIQSRSATGRVEAN